MKTIEINSQKEYDEFLEKIYCSHCGAKNPFVCLPEPANERGENDSYNSDWQECSSCGHRVDMNNHNSGYFNEETGWTGY